MSDLPQIVQLLLLELQSTGQNVLHGFLDRYRITLFDTPCNYNLFSRKAGRNNLPLSTSRENIEFTGEELILRKFENILDFSDWSKAANNCFDLTCVVYLSPHESPGIVYKGDCLTFL